MKRLLLLIPFLVLTACELAVDVDVPDGGPQMAVNALSLSDSTWRVDVSRAWGILEDSWNLDSITNATVTVTDETAATSVVLQRQYYGRYRYNQLPISGHQYSLKVEAEDYPDVTASTIAPAQIQFTLAELDTVNLVRYKNEDHYSIKFSFIDPPGKNTYEVSTFTRDSSYLDFQENPRWVVSQLYVPYTRINDPALVITEDFFNQNAGVRFSDESFEGKEKTITVLIPLYFVKFSGAYKVGVRIGNQGSEYARFVDDRNLQVDVRGFPFAQPVPVYSNLSNRNGIFAISTRTDVEFDVR